VGYQEASPSPVYGAALLMRFGFAPIRGSNPRASAIPEQALRRPGGVPALFSETLLVLSARLILAAGHGK
jgi:hypothetical protein